MANDMKMTLFDKVKDFVVISFIEYGMESDIEHHLKTVYYVKQLRPNADESLLIAAVSHDLERALEGDWKSGSEDPVKLRKHQELSACYVEKYLRTQNASDELINKVTGLILHHEEGGDEDQNVLCDADCLAWLDEKAVRKATEAKRNGTADEYREKLKFMVGRMHSPQALRIAKLFYDHALYRPKKAGKEEGGRRGRRGLGRNAAPSSFLFFEAAAGGKNQVRKNPHKATGQMTG